MTFSAGILGSSSSRVAPRPPRLEDYDGSSDTDSGEASRATSHPRTRSTFGAPTTPLNPDYLFPPPAPSGLTSLSSTAASSPVPSRASSPFRQFFSSHPSSSCTSDTDSEPNSPLLRTRVWREDRRRWWMIGTTTRRRRKGVGNFMRTLKKFMRRIVKHPLFPRQPITIVLTLLLLSVFAVFLTLLLIYILDPDKEPLPWRAYCSVPSSTAAPDYLSPLSTPILSTSGAMLPPFPPVNLDSMSPAGVFVGVFSVDSAFERRMLVRTTWASHPRSRNGAGEGDGGTGTSRTIVRFILGQPRKDWERRIQLENRMYNDIIVLPVAENMNTGKTHSFFSWASLNAWVPPVYSTSQSPPQFSYSNHTSVPPPLAPHDSPQAWEAERSGKLKKWHRPDFVVKVDDDSFIMLAELEARLRLELQIKSRHQSEEPYSSSMLQSRAQSAMLTVNSSADASVTGAMHTSTVDGVPLKIEDPLVYWGYLVKNRFMAGELYGLSWSLVDWVAHDPVVKTLTKGAEDKQTAKWMKLHPRSQDIRWTSERCWIYDHPRSGTVYSHGFLFPSEVGRIRRSMTSSIDKAPQDVLGAPANALVPTPAAWAYSSVSTFGVRYSPPVPDLTPPQSVEALVEGSDMSKIREGSAMTAEYAWRHREGRLKRYEEKRVGGTVVVHFIKKNMWYLETALALLDGEEHSESERMHTRASEQTAVASTITR